MATHGTLPPTYNAPTMTPPATGQVGPYTATQTFLIEASRGNSLIDTDDGGDFNAKWTNSANFNLRRGDRVSVEMAAFNAKNAGGGQATIELTGERARANGKIQPYSDNKVLLEVFFYLNNNNTYSVGLPFKFPTGAPVPNMIPPTASTAAWNNIPGVDGEVNPTYAKGADWGNIFTPTTNVEEAANNYGCVGLGWGEGFARPMILGGVIVYGNCPYDQSYGIYDFHIAGQPANVYTNFVGIGDIIDGFSLIKTGDGQPAPPQEGIFSNWTEGYYGGLRAQGKRFNGLIGMGVKFLTTGSTTKTIDYPPAILGIEQQTLLGIGLTDRIFVRIAVGADATDGYTMQVSMTGSAGGGAFSYCYFGPAGYDFENPDGQVGLTLPNTQGPANAGMIGFDNMRSATPDTTFYQRRGGLFGMFNENNIGVSISGLGTMSLENRLFPNATGIGLFGSYIGEGFAGNSSIDVSGNTYNQTGFHTGHEGYRNCNLMKENNNKPYILTRNDFYGMGKVSPDLTNFLPELKPQTAFILLDAAELFTDLETLANRINDILHQRLPTLGLELDNYSDYLLNTQEYDEDYQKGSSVIPYALINNGYYDPALYNKDLSPAPPKFMYNLGTMQGMWDTIPNISSGGTVKVITANFQPGYNFAITHTNKYYQQGNLGAPGLPTGLIFPNPLNDQYIFKQSKTYCRRVETADSQPFTESNTIYGNMCYENMPKMMMGDILKRFPVYTPTTITSNYPFQDPVAGAPPVVPIQDGLTSLSMPCILNTKLYYNYATSSNAQQNIRSQVFDAGSILFTNIYWLGSGTSNSAVGTSSAPLEYDWRVAKDQPSQNGSGVGDGIVGPDGIFEKFADCLRRYELYTRSSSSDGQPLDKQAATTFQGQDADNEGWSVEMDLGISDDPANAGGFPALYNGAVHNQQGLYPIPPNFNAVTVAGSTPALGYTNPVSTGKTTNMLPILFPGINKFPAVADPNPNQVPAANYWGTGVGGSDTNGDAADPPNLNQIRRDRICPAYSNSAFGSLRDTISQWDLTFDWNQDFKTLRGTGKIKVRSRPTGDYFKKNSAGEYVNLVPVEQTTPPYTGVPSAQPLTADTQCELIDPNLLDTDTPGLFFKTRGTLEYYKQLGLPFVPYKHTDSDGTSRILCALIVSNRYEAKMNEPNTWNLGEITWGTPIGVSPSFLDNHAIAPMNGDAVNHRNPLVNAPDNVTYPHPNTIIPPNTAIARNNFNYIYIGAPNPTFQFNSNKNRFEFLELENDTTFSAFTTMGTSFGQQGTQVAIVNASTRDSVFSILDPYMWTQGQPNPAQAAPAVKIPPYEQGGAVPAIGRALPIPNQGIRDSESGVGIWNVWLCPPDYTFPVGINPVSYWNQKEASLTSNMGGVEFQNLRTAPNPCGSIEANHRAIVKGCVKASRDVWEGSLLYKLGFTGEQFDPYYGRSYNRYDPNTYNNTNPNFIGTGVKPLILGCDYNNTVNPAANIFYKSYPDGPPTVASGDPNLNGLPKFQVGLSNNQPINVQTQGLPLTATDSPILTDSPFFLIYSNICETNYQSGSTAQPALAYVMRNFPNSGYFYGGGSNYSQMINQDRVLSQITTEVRNPSTGELAKLSPNSVLMYKIEREVVMPAPTIDAMGQQPMAEGPLPLPDPNLTALNEIIAELGGNPTRGGAGGANAVNTGGGGGGIQDTTGAANHNQAVATWTIEPDGQVIQQPPPAPVQPAPVPQPADIGGDLMNPGSQAEFVGSELEMSADGLPDMPLDGGMSWRNRPDLTPIPLNAPSHDTREENVGENLLKQGKVIDKLLSLIIAKIPLRVEGQNGVRDANKIPEQITAGITGMFNVEDGNLFQFISDYTQEGATVDEIVNYIAPIIGNSRFNQDGSIMSRTGSESATSMSDMVFDGSSRSGKRFGVRSGNVGRIFLERIKDVIKKNIATVPRDDGSKVSQYVVANLNGNTYHEIEDIVRRGIETTRAIVIESKNDKGQIMQQDINMSENTMSTPTLERNNNRDRDISRREAGPRVTRKQANTRSRVAAREANEKREADRQYFSDRRSEERKSDKQSSEDSRRTYGTATRRGVGLPRVSEEPSQRPPNPPTRSQRVAGLSSGNMTRRGDFQQRNRGSSSKQEHDSGGQSDPAAHTYSYHRRPTDQNRQGPQRTHTVPTPPSNPQNF
tara:strand:+ start:906 stop:7382 length:6477 start_codon:yes stop_codon:yes gene_type:complete